MYLKILYRKLSWKACAFRYCFWKVWEIFMPWFSCNPNLPWPPQGIQRGLSPSIMTYYFWHWVTKQEAVPMVGWLSPTIGHTYIKDCEEVLKILNTFMWSEDFLWVTCDVTGLYSSIPHHLTCIALAHHLYGNSHSIMCGMQSEFFFFMYGLSIASVSIDGYLFFYCFFIVAYQDLFLYSFVSVFTYIQFTVWKGLVVDDDSYLGSAPWYIALELIHYWICCLEKTYILHPKSGYNQLHNVNVEVFAIHHGSCFSEYIKLTHEKPTLIILFPWTPIIYLINECNILLYVCFVVNTPHTYTVFVKVFQYMSPWCSYRLSIHFSSIMTTSLLVLIYRLCW